jgi:hypothetical protein
VVIYLVDRRIGDLAPEFANTSVCYDRIEFGDALGLELFDSGFGIGWNVAVDFDDDVAGILGDWESADLGDGGVADVADGGDDGSRWLREIFAEQFFADTCEKSVVVFTKMDVRTSIGPRNEHSQG